MCVQAQFPTVQLLVTTPSVVDYFRPKHIISLLTSVYAFAIISESLSVLSHDVYADTKRFLPQVMSEAYPRVGVSKGVIQGQALCCLHQFKPLGMDSIP